MIVHTFKITNSFKTILAIHGIAFFFMFIFFLLSSMWIEQILTVPLSWLTNANVTQTSQGYGYGGVSGNYFYQFYQINEDLKVQFNPLSYVFVGTVFFGAIISLLVLIKTTIKGLRVVSVKVLIIWIPFYIMLVLLKLDDSYTILKFLA